MITSNTKHFPPAEKLIANVFHFQRAGYISNYEIFEILAKAENPDLYGNITISQSSSDVVGDVLIYNKTNWISWLSPSSYASRRSWTDGLNFGGTSDWAVDLNETYSDNGTGSSVDSGYDDDDDYTPCDYTKTFKSLDDLSSSAGDLRSDCVAVYALQVLIDMLDTAYANYTDVNNGYDDLFGYYVTYIDKLVPNILQDAFMFNITSDDENWKNVGGLPELGYGMDCKNSFPSLLSFCLFLGPVLNEYLRLHLQIQRHYISLQPSSWDIWALHVLNYNLALPHRFRRLQRRPSQSRSFSRLGRVWRLPNRK